MTTDAVHIATATNAAYLHWTATTILSAIDATRDRHVHAHVVVDSDVGSADRERLARMGAEAGAVVSFIDLDHGRLDDLPEPVLNHGGAISCARFLLPDQLPDVERLVYLDADTLVLRSLTALAHTVLDGHGIAAVANVVEPRMRWHLERVGLADRPYLNSGVLVMDLDWMRRHDTAAALLDVVRASAELLLWVDQDALNLVFGTDWARLHPRWNAQNSLWRWPGLAAEVFDAETVREAIDDPAVIHFEGPSLAKPWHFLSSHPYRDRYRAAATATPWGTVEPHDRTAATRLISAMPDRWRIPAYTRLLRLRESVRRSR